MQDLIVACILAFVIEGIYYALFPEKSQEMMRMISKMEPEALRKAGIAAAIVGVIIIAMIKR